MKLLTVHGASARSSVTGMSPAVVFMTAFTLPVAGVGPACGAFAVLADFSPWLAG